MRGSTSLEKLGGLSEYCDQSRSSSGTGRIVCGGQFQVGKVLLLLAQH